MVSMGPFCLENYTEGVKFAQLGIGESQANASLYAHLAVNLMGLGRQEEAAAAIAEMRRASAVFADRALAGRMQYRNPEYLQRSTTFLRRAAGVDKPEALPVAAALTLPDKPSIAVLPFQNMSGDPEQEYFADGMVEDIITALSLFVIARNSSFTYKGASPDIRQVGRDLGVRYVLEGSVRRMGGKVRIAGQLIDSQTGAHLWADRFDGLAEHVFDLHDQVTASVVGIVAPKVDQAEIDRARRKPVDNLDAYDCFLRGMAQMRDLTQASYEEGLRLFYRAIELDLEFATPYGMVARCYAYIRGQGWSKDREHEAKEVRRMAARVTAIGVDDALALSSAGFALARVCLDDDTGTAMMDRALAINHNLAVGWANRGSIGVIWASMIRALSSSFRLCG